ncbi:DMT family transporter [Stygiolobus caldivivus]|uniref:EamA family transporter n=1 Tax=Stygiolobus caldivivus TaxID=2824673 RepID=A0A8D5ZFH5_9CREN|nr:EamA family transporter [Stygiolobus caldivivus]BCU70258.1 EamA family transporter [Stygiolobus caldivivus]
MLPVYLIPYVLIGTFLYSVTKDGLEYASPPVFMEMRYLLSGIILFAITRKIIINKDIFLLSLFTSTSTALWSYGLLYVPPSESAVLSYTMPLFAIPISFLVLRETPKVNEIAGIVVGFIGVLVYASSLTVSVIGGTLTVINAIFWALFSVYYRKLRDYDHLVVNSSQFLLGSVFFLLLIPFNYRLDLSTRFLLDFSYSTFLGGLVMFLLWNLMLSVEKVNKVVVLIFSIPVFSTLFDYFRGVIEVTPAVVGGMGIILSGLFISELGKERKRLGIQAKRK